MPDFAIPSTRGGQNDFDSSLAIQNDQVVSARNVEWTSSMLGERRLGCTGIDLVGSDLEDHDRVTFLQRHTPGESEVDAELWGWGVSDDDSHDLCRKDDSWHTLTFDDAPDMDGDNQYSMQGQSLHGKNFLAYHSDEDRLHVVDSDFPDQVRRAGLREPDPPTSAETGTGGSYSGERQARVRFVTVNGDGVVVRRSEPSEVLIVTPTATKTGTVFTKPANIDEGETHWELELATDNANFYRFARTVIATPTVTDTTAYTPGYQALGADYPLSEAIGSYSLLPSFKFLVVDRDRLVGLGSRFDFTQSCQVIWTPVGTTVVGVGHDERWDANNEPRLDLDTNDGGGLTGGATTSGVIFGFKLQRIYQLSSSGQVKKAYGVRQVSGTRGAIEGSVVEADDAAGESALYFIDPKVGPMQLSVGNGLRRCGRDITRTWKRLNVNATVPARCVYYPDKGQIRWWIAVDGSETTNLMIVLHTAHTVADGDELRKGWAVWDGAQSEAVYAACLFATNIDDDTDRSLALKPFIAQGGDVLISMCDTGDEDNEEEYAASQLSKPLLRRNGLNQFGIMRGAVIGKAVTDASVEITLIGNFGQTGYTREATAEFTPEDSETSVVVHMDSLGLAELRAVQILIEDPETPGARWELEHLAFEDENGQRG